MVELSTRSLTLVTVFGVLIEDDSILMFRRATEPDLGTLTLPGGHKHRHEDLVTACIRETAEETGLTMIEPTFVGMLETHNSQAPYDYLSFYYRSTHYEGTLTPSSEGQPQWLTLAEVLVAPDCHQAFVALAPFLTSLGNVFHGRAVVDDHGRGHYNVARIFSPTSI
jgi:8-oxo-dGTP diphosphatase